MTAVEWFYQRILAKDIESIFEQAKEMEKEQIIDAWKNGFREFYDGSSTPEEYYNETFKDKL